MIDEGWQWAAIIVSFLSLFATIGLVIYVRFLDGKQKQRDERFYITATMKDIEQLKEHLINIQNISEPSDPIPSKDEQIEITQKLVRYGENNKQIMESLIADTRFSMSKWMTLDDSERRNVENFISTTNWVLGNFIPKSNENKETQMRRWSNYFKEFQERKNKSSKKIDNLVSKHL